VPSSLIAPSTYEAGKLPTNTTMTAQYAAVAENNSYVLDDVKQQSADENIAVKPAMIHSLIGTA
jgi:hypothetical protein